tara:strand:+ start:445 stop:639 length:195 start_codon:yes stop_codon:yes gene_type:complete
MHAAVGLAFSTTVPLFLHDALGVLDDLHPVTKAVCVLYFKHLRMSWFALENDKLDVVYKKLASM